MDLGVRVAIPTRTKTGPPPLGTRRSSTWGKGTCGWSAVACQAIRRSAGTARPQRLVHVRPPERGSGPQDLCLKPKEEGNLVPALRRGFRHHTGIRNRFSQGCDGKPRAFQRTHIALKWL
jgi:hypothetical protein